MSRRDASPDPDVIVKPVCLVIGAGAGIGGNVGKRFAREGYHAVLCRRSDEPGLDRLVAAIEEDGGSATGFLLNAVEPDAIEERIALVEAEIGPIEVLLPFAIVGQTGAGPSGHALVLAVFGVGGALGSIVVAAGRLPRRYLTWMVLLWGAGCAPLAVIGFTDRLWVMTVAVFVVGVTGGAAMVIWGTLLQRRVPPHLLGRVSSLDFFVSLALMPLSMALAGPVGTTLGIPMTFVLVGAIPVALACAAIAIWRLDRDELAHPLDASAPPVTTPAS